MSVMFAGVMLSSAGSAMPSAKAPGNNDADADAADDACIVLAVEKRLFR